MLMTMITSSVSFSALSISSFSNTTFSNSFQASFQAQMAASAGVSSSAVVIISITAGSVLVLSEVTFSAGFSQTSAFASELQSSPANIFTDPSFAQYGLPSTTAMSTTTAAMSTPVRPFPPPPPPPSPPPPPPLSERRCWEDNGGCDVRTACLEAPLSPEGRVCSACPIEFVDVAGDGTECVEKDVCLQDGMEKSGVCYPGVECKVSGGTYVCGACPEGLQGNGESCSDVDECSAGTEVCWALDSNLRTTCVNAEGSYSCTACPSGFKGSGGTECRRESPCADDNGGCDPRSTCTEASPGFSECGPCSTGYSGSGDLGCTDTDGCAKTPCFTGSHGATVECHDVAAPGEGYTCGQCPEGYRGNGESCELCTTVAAIVASSSVNGTVLRTQTVQVVGEVEPLQAGCTNELGLVFEWVATSGVTGMLPLSADANKADTLTLTLPAGSLEALNRYTFRLEARMTGNARVSGAAEMEMLVKQEPLQALIVGGGGKVGEDALLVLDGSESVDPDDAPGEMAYHWYCKHIRTEGAAGAGGGVESEACRDRTGADIPTPLNSSAVRVHLQGSLEGLVYKWELKVEKNARHAMATTTVVVVKGAPPVPAITPFPGKANPDERLTLSADVQLANVSGQSGAAVLLEWSVEAVEGTGAAQVSLEAGAGVLASLTTGLTSLVLHENSLSPGGAYVFTLRAALGSEATSVGGGAAEEALWGSASLRVTVNAKPTGGALTVHPPSGVALATYFLLNTSTWQDEDAPLEYLFAYRIVGAVPSQEVFLSSFAPGLALETMMPDAGLEEFESLVEVTVYARDRYNAVGSPQRANITVSAREIETEEEATAFVGDIMLNADAALANGHIDSAVNAVNGALSVLSTTEATRRHMRRRRLQQEDQGQEYVKVRREQREQMIDLVGEVNGKVVATSKSQERMAQLVARIVDSPQEESSTETQSDAVSVLADLMLRAEAAPQGGAESLALAAAAPVMSGLSNVLAHAKDHAKAVRGVLETMRKAFLQRMVAGEVEVELATTELMLRVQRDSLAEPGCTADRVIGQQLIIQAGPAPSVVMLPIEVALEVKAAGEVTMDLELMAMTADPNAAEVTREVDNSTGKVFTVTVRNEVGAEMSIANLTSPVELNLTTAEEALQAVASGEEVAPVACVFWDQQAERYSTAGAAPAGSNATHSDSGWYRAYHGEGCGVSGAGNEARCSWSEALQGFVGAGCELEPVLQCRCTHLSDFRAIESVGSLEQTPEVELLTMDDIVETPFSPEENILILGIVGCMAAGTLVLTVTSSRVDMYRRWQLRANLRLAQNSTFVGLSAEEKQGLKTWGIFEEEFPIPLCLLLLHASKFISGGSGPGSRAALSSSHMQEGCQRSAVDIGPPVPISSPVYGSAHMAYAVSKMDAEPSTQPIPGLLTESLHFPPKGRLPLRGRSGHSLGRVIVTRSQAAFQSKRNIATSGGAHHHPPSAPCWKQLMRQGSTGPGLYSPRPGGRQRPNPLHSAPGTLEAYDLFFSASKLCARQTSGFRSAQRQPEELEPELEAKEMEQRWAAVSPSKVLAVGKKWASSLHATWQRVPQPSPETAADRGPARGGAELWKVVRQKVDTVRQEVHRVRVAASVQLCKGTGLTATRLRLALPLAGMSQMCQRQAKVEASCDLVIMRRKSGTSSCGMKQVQLPLARALGTALVLAHVTLRRLQNDEDIKRQLRLAAEADWELPGGRTFRWHVDAFMVMLSGHLSAPGWPKRAVLWNLVLLQEAEGDWYPSDDLATALQAGTPVHTGCAARPRCSAAAILESMPTGLVAELGGRKVLAERAWASLLAVAKYNRLPETWCSNPQAEPPAAKRDLCDSTTEWLNQLGSEHADFQVSRSSHERTGPTKAEKPPKKKEMVQLYLCHKEGAYRCLISPETVHAKEATEYERNRNMAQDSLTIPLPAFLVPMVQKPPDDFTIEFGIPTTWRFNYMVFGGDETNEEEMYMPPAFKKPACLTQV
ncbi:hypothetical protein CYMTET_53130 [Cymbomonas tetramitiformis]|uniref:EGF-like domain-containing protein n=1 Tax=Cymbomonas tetramitiformis TaxID=36881 RepID=A0AAE0BHM7_9CHLO|nr:hypothetical protein CYMTET_53130 [Cymbomonas tetramitiformis]